MENKVYTPVTSLKDIYKTFSSNPLDEIDEINAFYQKSLNDVRGKVDNYVPIRISAMNDLDPSYFKPFDLLLFILSEIAEKSAKPVSEGGSGISTPENLFRDILYWFAKEKTLTSVDTQIGSTISSEIGMGNPNWLRLFFKRSSLIKGEIKYASNRKTTK